MRLARARRSKGEGGLALLIIVLLILGGIVWWLFSSRQSADKKLRSFATEVFKRIAIDHDERYITLRLSAEGQTQSLKSWRERMIEQLREFGVPEQPLKVEGDVEFTSYFFQARGTFKTHLKYPSTSADLEVGVSHGGPGWQIDAINVMWERPPTPTPTPSPIPSPTPSPTPEQKSARKGR